MFVSSALLLLATGCEAQPDGHNADAADTRNEQQASTQQTPADADGGKSAPAATERVIWQWLDANIGSQERLAASRTGQRLSGVDVGDEVELAAHERLLFREQLNLLYEIKRSKNVAIARQYMLVHTLMTLNEAERTRSLLTADDPRYAGVLQQIATAKELLKAIEYDRHMAANGSADQKSK